MNIFLAAQLAYIDFAMWFRFRIPAGFLRPHVLWLLTEVGARFLKKSPDQSI